MVASSVIALLFTLSVVYSLDNGLGRTPQMGWNSWNHFACNINEALIKKTADAIASGPLKAAGYVYVNLDDCWQTSRNSSGHIIEDPKAFPSGMKSLADYVHNLGLKFGLYSDAGTKTCAGRPGSLGYEKQDAQTYASWGVDYLKYDNCNTDGSKPEVRYPVMRDALNATGRHIFYSMCEWGVDNPATWAASVGNSWRTTGDINDKYATMVSIIGINNQWASKAGPGGWNDPDMLEVGNGGMTTEEYRTHFSLWSLSKAPLIIGCDVTNLKADTVSILTNPEVIAINQDTLGAQGERKVSQSTYEIWSGPLADKGVVAILWNKGTTPLNITARFSDIGVPTQARAVRDLWNRRDLGAHTTNYTATNVPAHGVSMVKISF